MVQAFRAALAAAPVPLEYRAPRFQPSIGAALYAARLAGRPLPEAALANLQKRCEMPGA
jgi:hypothetical protein